MKNLLNSFLVILTVVLIPEFFILHEAAAQQKKTILIQLPLSGPMAAVGQSLRAGIELAIREHKEAAKLDFIFDDNQYSGKIAIASLQAFHARGQADLLIIFGGPTTLAIRSFVEERKIPTFAFSAAAQLDSGGNGYIKRIWESASTMGSLIAENIRNRNLKSVAIVSTENDVNLAIASQIERNLPAKFTFNSLVSLQETDFRAIVTRLRASKADVVVSNLMAGQHTILISRLKEQGLDLPVIAQSGIFFDSKARPPYSPILEGVTVASVDEKAAASFYQRLDPSSRAQNSVFMTANGYDGINSIFDTIAKGWKMDSPWPAINIHGVLGEYRSVNDVALEPPMGLFKFKNSRLVPVAE